MMRTVSGVVLLALISGTAHAALQSRLSGQAYYDTVLNVTWVADANLADTNAFGVPGINADGSMDLDQATQWIAALNAASYLGASDWRLPTTTQPDATCSLQDGFGNGYGFGCTGSEMGHLHYVDGITSATPGPFANVQSGTSWSDSPYAPNPPTAWSFRGDGFQDFLTNRASSNFVWAVRAGDIDADGDGFAEGADNCTRVANLTQLDVDGDDYGNLCDADLNNSGIVTTADFGLLRSVLGQLATFSPLAAVADLNGSGTVTTADFGLLRARLGTAPGPAGIDLRYPLTVIKAGNGGGTVSSSPAGISCGADCVEAYSHDRAVQLTAVPVVGSTFGGWTGACAGAGVCVVTMEAARSVSATFTINSYALSVTRSGTGAGTVTSSPSGINCGGDCTELYNHNTVVTLVPGQVAGSSFDGWSGACTGTGNCVLTMTAPASVVASYTLLDGNPVCPSNVFLGPISGDSGSGLLSTSGVGEKWFRVRVTEDNSSVIPVDLTARVTLTSPAGGDYDLYAYCLSCGGALGGFSTLPGGQIDTISVRRNEAFPPGGDDGFDALIEVRYFSGTTSSPWSLSVIGNTQTGAVSCFGP